MASSIPLAAQNEGGLAGLGAGLASGVAFGQVMAQGLTGAAAATPATPATTPAAEIPAVPVAAAAAASAEEDIELRLGKLKSLFDKSLISASDYDSAKAELLKKLIG